MFYDVSCDMLCDMMYDVIYEVMFQCSCEVHVDHGVGSDVDDLILRTTDDVEVGTIDVLLGR